MTNALLCRSVYQISFPVKSGSMTGTVPGKLLRIPVQFAAHMGTDNIHLAELSFFCFIHPGFSLWGICHCTMSPQKLCRRFSRQMKLPPGSHRSGVPVRQEGDTYHTAGKKVSPFHLLYTYLSAFPLSPGQSHKSVPDAFWQNTYPENL